MDKYEKLDRKFYTSKHYLPKTVDPNIMWEDIKTNKEILNWAIKPTKDKFGERDIVNGLSICESILIDYDNVDKDVYNKLISLIYSNKQIARIVQDGYSNGGYSYLLMTLWNPNLKLTKEQKMFAVDEAMNKAGTVRYKIIMDEYAKKLDDSGITNDKTMYTEFGGSINPVGAKTGNMYMASIFYTLSDTQAHGSGSFDIRYHILRNSNWTLDEKKKLIMAFWYDDDEYDETLEDWEFGVINHDANINAKEAIDKCFMYEYSYDDLLEIYNDKDTAKYILDEINFCKQMHELRPTQIELDYDKAKVLEKNI